MVVGWQAAQEHRELFAFYGKDADGNVSQV
jgi:hypothetical protein